MTRCRNHSLVVGNAKKEAACWIGGFIVGVFIAALGVPGRAFPQKAERLPRVGVLVSATPPHPFADAFRRGLQPLGYVENENITIEWRYTEGKSDRAAALARELVQLDVNVIVAHFTPAVRAAMVATQTIPIVMAPAGAPVQSGFVDSLAMATQPPRARETPAKTEALRFAGAHRLVTLTGAGGIGKTTLALALGRKLRPHFVDGVWLAEFSALANHELVPATVAAAVGLELGGGEASAQRVAQALANRRLLLVLDTCEHVIDAAATLAEAVLRAGSAARIITTSREPLRSEGEQIYLVPPLAVPAVEDEDPWRHGAVLLFLFRSRAADGDPAASRARDTCQNDAR